MQQRLETVKSAKTERGNSCLSKLPVEVQSIAYLECGRHWIATRLMAHKNQQTRMGQLELQTAASVWNAIRYLDSPTDYREHLPYMARSARLQASELVLLDAPRYSWPALGRFIFIIIFGCMMLLLLLRA